MASIHGFTLPCHFAKPKLRGLRGLRGLGIPSGDQNQAPLHGVEHVVLGTKSCFFGDHTWMAKEADDDEVIWNQNAKTNRGMIQTDGDHCYRL